MPQRRSILLASVLAPALPASARSLLSPTLRHLCVTSDRICIASIIRHAVVQTAGINCGYKTVAAIEDVLKGEVSPYADWRGDPDHLPPKQFAVFLRKYSMQHELRNLGNRLDRRVAQQLSDGCAQLQSAYVPMALLQVIPSRSAAASSEALVRVADDTRHLDYFAPEIDRLEIERSPGGMLVSLPHFANLVRKTLRDSGRQ